MVNLRENIAPRLLAALCAATTLAYPGSARAEAPSTNRESGRLPETLPYVARMVPPPGYAPASHPKYGLLLAGGVFFGLGYYGQISAKGAGDSRFVPVVGPLVEHYAGYELLQLAGLGFAAWSILSPHRDFALVDAPRAAATQPGVAWNLSPRAGGSGFELDLSGRF